MTASLLYPLQPLSRCAILQHKMALVFNTRDGCFLAISVIAEHRGEKHFQSSQTVIELGSDNALSVNPPKGCLRC